MCGVASVRRYASRSARCVLIRGLWFGSAFHNGRTRRILDRNAARQSRVTRSSELRNRGRRDARARRGRSWRTNSWRAGLGISTRDKNVCICAPRKDWLSVGKGACAWTSPCANAPRTNPSPRQSRRSGARVSEGPGLAGARNAKGEHVHQNQRYATCAAERCVAARRSLPGSADRSEARPGPKGP